MGCSVLSHSAHFPPRAQSFYELKEGRVHALVRLISLFLWFCYVDSLKAFDIYARHFEYSCMRCLFTTENKRRSD